MDTMLIWLAVGIILMCGAIGYVVYALKENVLNPTGRGAEKKTAGILRRFGGIRGFKVLSGLDLEADGKTAFVENMLIGYFGILMVHTCGARGEYYGTLEEENWSIVLDGQKTIFPNPLLEQQKAIQLLRGIFSSRDIYSVPVDNVVVVSNTASKTALYITNSGEILKPGQLKAYLGKSKFEKDNGIDIDKLVSVIEEHCK